MDTLMENPKPATFSPKKLPKRRNNSSCAVSGCNSNYCDNPTVRFHGLPAPNQRFAYMTDYFGNSNKVDRLEAWKRILGLKTIKPRLMVCSLHFKKEDYIFPDITCIRRKLKQDSIPSCNLPASKISKTHEARLRRRLLRSIQKLNPVEQQNIEAEVSCEALNEIDENIIIHYEQDTDFVVVQDDENRIIHYAHDADFGVVQDDEKNIHDSVVYCNEVVTVPSNPEIIDEFEESVESQPIKPTSVRFMDMINNNSQLSTAAGIESFDILHTIVNCFHLVVGDRYEKQNVVMKTADRVLLTYMKLKQNLSFRLLAIMFHSVTSTHCERIFEDTIKILSPIMKKAIPWPSREQIQRNLPLCFDQFENVRVVLDCAEIFIQRPKKLCCQLVTYSYYKGGQTAKFMTGVTPAGNISFVSEAYGGRASDTAIFQQSDLIKLLEPGDGVMVDRGFLIDEVCRTNQWKCIRPPFMKDKKQLSQEESIATARIAKARVHIERSNQRIKTFKILSSSVPSPLVPLIDDIFIVICGTINLSSPIIKDKYFMETKKL